MLFEYSNMYLPICSLIMAGLVFVIYFSKPKVCNNETKVYSLLVIFSLIEALCTTLLTLCVHLFFNENTTIYFAIVNKVLYIIYIIWISILFLYFAFLSYGNNKNQKNLMKWIAIVIDSIMAFCIIISDIELIYLNNYKVSNSYGMAANILFIGCAFYIFLMIVIGIINFKKFRNKTKYIPLLSLIIAMSIAMIIRLVDPYVNMTSNVISLITMIMYFTIENPDLKMLEELEIAKRYADNANNAKTEFLTSMSHEIRTPLNAIMGLSEDNITYNSKLPKVVAENNEDILNAARNVVEIVGGILDINKIESGKLEIIEASYNFKDEITNLVKITSTRIGNKKINFEFNLDENIPNYMIGDKVHVKEIINNLLTNAIKYTDEGNIKLNVKSTTKKNICNLTICVEDTGKGIKKSDISKIFNKFERLDAPKNSTIEGTGLGLSITKKLIEMMNGNISVKSEFGKGSIFTVNIPQKIDKSQTNENYNNVTNKNDNVKHEKNTNCPNDKKILVVDDNKLNIKVARRTLETLGYKVDDCLSGKECLEKIKGGNCYDLILMDIMMPEMSGEETLQKLKEISNFNIPTIALTADAVAGAKEKYLKEGFIDYISKPFTKDQIKERLDLYII